MADVWIVAMQGKNECSNTIRLCICFTFIYYITLYRVAHDKVAPPTDQGPRAGSSSSKCSHVMTVALPAAGMPGN